MKFSLSLLLIALFVAFALAAAPNKQVIVSYPKGTPDSVIEKAKHAIKEAGGIITHEYNLIKAFAASAPAKVLDTVQTMGAEYNAVVEEDQMVSINGPAH
ncbi:hypothetical protein AAFC00_005237 [Neodothiora populina]|uniref:Uncharacterized protein n=1 Tax=Neodothiora populina TaxID=2781224 RepID=A0ABR3PKF2_9PEZI